MTEPAVSSLRVFIADDHPVVLDGVRSQLAGDPRVQIIGEAADGETALNRAIELKPAIMVLDLSMPGLNGVEVARRLLAQLPDCKIVVLTVHEDRAYLHKLIEIGASAYVLKRSVAGDLLRAIHAVAAGGIYLDPSITARALDKAPNKGSGTVATGADFSGREMEVLRHTAMGHSNKAIAQLMQISIKSVETYKARAMSKLRFRNRAELVRYALEKGWMTES